MLLSRLLLNVRPRVYNLTSMVQELEEFSEKPKHESIKNKSFPKMLRESKFVQLGDFSGQTVYGEIVYRNDDDLYVDFGLKFTAVVKRPAYEDKNKFVIGAWVKLKLYDPELSEHFLGSQKAITLLEADAALIELFEPEQQKKRISILKDMKVTNDPSQLADVKE